MTKPSGNAWYDLIFPFCKRRKNQSYYLRQNIASRNKTKRAKILRDSDFAGTSRQTNTENLFFVTCYFSWHLQKRQFLLFGLVLSRVLLKWSLGICPNSDLHCVRCVCSDCKTYFWNWICVECYDDDHKLGPFCWLRVTLLASLFFLKQKDL